MLREGGAGSVDMRCSLDREIRCIVARMDVRGTVSAGVVASWYC